MTSTTSLLERLRESHHATRNPYALEIWSTFATAVADAVGLAGARLATPALHVSYASRRGWWRSRRRVNAHGASVRIPSEDAITDALVEQLEQLRNEARPGDPLIDMNITFAGQQPRRRQRHIGPAALTTDIRAHVPDNRDLDMRIEAKVLFQAGDVRSEYLGRRGLLRFADPQNPYSDTPVGAMLGFVVAPCAQPWPQLIHDGLHTTVEAQQVGHVALVPQAEPVSVCDLTYGDLGRVTVLHLRITEQTEPSSWMV